MDKHNVLVWTSDVGKFVKECTEKGIAKNIEIKDVLVLGEELKTSDLKALFEINLSFDINSQYAPSKEATEVFILGRCYEQSMADNATVGLIGFAPLSKEATEIAKFLGIPIASWSSLKGKSSTRKTPSKKGKESETPKTKQKEPNSQTEKKEMKRVPVKKNTVQKELPKPKPVKSNPVGTVSSSVNEDEIAKLINSSSLSASDKAFFTEPLVLVKIAEAVTKASDVTIGLPFQLKMYFGEKGAALEEILKKNFVKLRK